MNKPIITFNHDEDQNDQNQSSWLWHYGTLTHEGKEYPFTILEMSDGASGTSTFELTWCDGEPVGLDPVKTEADVMSAFEKQDDEPVALDKSIKTEREKELLYLIREMYEALRDNTPIVHIGDLVCKELNIEATFYPSGEIEER